MKLLAAAESPVKSFSIFDCPRERIEKQIRNENSQIFFLSNFVLFKNKNKKRRKTENRKVSSRFRTICLFPSPRDVFLFIFLTFFPSHLFLTKEEDPIYHDDDVFFISSAEEKGNLTQFSQPRREKDFILLIDWQIIKVDWITNVQFILVFPFSRLRLVTRFREIFHYDAMIPFLPSPRWPHES